MPNRRANAAVFRLPALTSSYLDILASWSGAILAAGAGYSATGPTNEEGIGCPDKYGCGEEGEGLVREPTREGSGQAGSVRGQESGKGVTELRDWDCEGPT